MSECKPTWCGTESIMPGKNMSIALATIWLIVTFWLTGEVNPGSSLLLPMLATVWIAAPILTLRLYRLTIRRSHDLHSFQNQGFIFRILSGRLLLAVFWLIYSVVFGYLTIFWLAYFTPLEWALALLAIPSLWLSFRFAYRISAGEFKPYIVVYRALGIIGWLLPLGLTSLYALVLLILATSAGSGPTPPSMPGAQNLAEPGVAGSQLVQLSLNWSATFHTIKTGIFNLAGEYTPLQPLLVVFSSFAMFLNLVMAYSAFLIPGKELRRIISPLSDSEPPPPVSSLSIIQLSAFSVLILLFILPGIFSSLEGLVRSHPQTVATLEQARQQSAPLVERVGETLVQPGTIAEIEALKVQSVSALQNNRDALEAALGTGFDNLRDNVDPFLDSYYSLPQEYWRLFSLLTGSLEGRIQQSLEENLLAGDPFADYSESVSQLLAANETIRLEYQDRLNALIANRQMQVGDYQVTRMLTQEASLLPPVYAVPAVTSIETRGGAAAVSGAIAAAVVAKISAKGTLKTAVMAVSKVLSSKMATGAAGAASGAAVGSVIPGPGTAVGAVIGVVAGLAVGISVDALLLELEEEWSRVEFRTDILAAINTQEQEMLLLIDASTGAGDI